MITRSNYQIDWRYKKDIAIGASIFIAPGSEYSAYTPAVGLTNIALVKDLPYFSINVWTDDALEIDIQTGMIFADMATLCTLTCAVGAAVNTVYDIPAPFNRDGFLIITSNYLRIRVRNNTGGIVSPFALQARSWR